MRVAFPFQIRDEVRDRLRIFLFFVLLAGAFSLATFAANAYHDERAGLAKRWFARGEDAVQKNYLEAAVEDYRNALAYDRDNQEYQLRLAQALAKLHRYNEAQYYLLGLWEREPGRGVVNLQLARLYGAQGDYPSSLRYYNNAIFGVWEENPEPARRQVRLELVRYLLQHDANSQADAELISLADEMPNTAAAHNELGRLFLQTQDFQRAYDQFQAGLRLDRNNDEAILGLGDAAFQLGRYNVAERYLRREIRTHPDNQRATALLDAMEEMDKLNPYSYRLSSKERADRVIKAFNTGNARLSACIAQEPGNVSLQTLQQQSNSVKDLATGAKLRRNTANIDAVMNLVFAIEKQAAVVCGNPSGADYALLLISKQREAMEQ